jgi:hypothetical protein
VATVLPQNAMKSKMPTVKVWTKDVDAMVYGNIEKSDKKWMTAQPPDQSTRSEWKWQLFFNKEMAVLDIIAEPNGFFSICPSINNTFKCISTVISICPIPSHFFTQNKSHYFN